MMMIVMMMMIASYTNDDGDRTRMYVRCMSKMGTNKQTNKQTDGKLNSRSRMTLGNLFVMQPGITSFLIYAAKAYTFDKID